MDLFKKVFKRSLVGVMCLLSLLCSVPSFATTVDKRVVATPPNGVYRIKNVATGGYLGAITGSDWGSIYLNTPVMPGNPSELEWIIQDTESSPSVSWYSVRPVNSPNLAIQFSDKDEYGELKTYITDDKASYYPNQRFTFNPYASGSYGIKSVAYGNNTDNRFWDISTGSLGLKKANDSNEQKFVLEFVRAY